MIDQRLKSAFSQHIPLSQHFEHNMISDFDNKIIVVKCLFLEVMEVTIYTFTQANYTV